MLSNAAEIGDCAMDECAICNAELTMRIPPDPRDTGAADRRYKNQLGLTERRPGAVLTALEYERRQIAKLFEAFQETI